MTTSPEVCDTAEALWRCFADPVRGFLRRRVRSEADADDLLQEVFLRVHRSLPKLHDTSKLQGWVYRIARNVVIDHHRKSHDDTSYDLIAETHEAGESDPTGRDEIDLTPTLRRFVAQLPAKYRDPLVSHEFQGQSLQEVAESQGLTLTAAKTRVRRARLLLREMLDRCCRFEFDRNGRVIDAIPRSACPCGPSGPEGRCR